MGLPAEEDSLETDVYDAPDELGGERYEYHSAGVMPSLVWMIRWIVPSSL